jgi:hypothetical protein
MESYLLKEIVSISRNQSAIGGFSTQLTLLVQAQEGELQCV